MAVQTTVGQGAYTYTVDPHWGRGPRGVAALGVAQGVTGDSDDRIYVFQRAPVAQVMIFSPDGALISTWGAGSFRSPHGIWMSPADELFITDTLDHTVSHWTKDGRLIRSWGSSGTPGAPGEPFNRPTKAIQTPDGEMYVADGYGNQRVHRYGRDGDRLHSWGERGTGPGQFVLPHDVVLDPSNRLLVCDRENRRIQWFDRQGAYLGEWSDWQNPMQVFIRDDVMYVAHAYAEISVRQLDGTLLARWPWQSVLTHEKEKSPHSLWVDSHGDIYVGEVVGEGGLQKFTRQR